MLTKMIFRLKIVPSPYLPGRDELGLDVGLPDEGLPAGSKLKLLLEPLIPPRPPLFLPFSLRGGATGFLFFLSPSDSAELRFSELWLTMGNT